MAFDFTRSIPFRRAALLLALQLGGALGGCSLAPAWQPPPLALPATLGGSTAAAGAPQAPAVPLSADEQRLLQCFAPDRDLAPLIAQVLAHSPDYRLAAAAVAQSRAAYQAAGAARLPVVAAQAQGQQRQFGNPALQERYQQKVFSAGLSIDSYELDFFGRLASLSDAARQRHLASEAGREAVRGALIAEALRAYVLESSAALARDRYQEIAADSAALLALAQRQAGVGLLARDDLARSRDRADADHVAALQAGDQARAAHRALQLLAGYDLASAPGTLAPLAQPCAAAPDWRALDSRVLLQRPDLRQAEAALRAADADIGAARAAFFPALQLSTSIGGASGALGSLFSGAGRTWSFLPQLTLPLFDFGGRRANLDLAWTRRQAGVADYEKTIESAFREVADALDAHATAAVAEARLREQHARAAQRAGRAQARAMEGLQDRQSLLAERVDANRSGLAHIDTQRELALSRIALFHAFYGIPLPSLPQGHFE